MVTIQASTLSAQLQTSGQYSYSVTKQGFAHDAKAEDASYNAKAMRQMIKHLKYFDYEDGSATELKKYVKNFVSEYNSLLDNTGKIENDKKIKKYTDKFDALLNKYEKELSDIGITKKTNGKLELDKTKFDEAKNEKVSEVFTRTSEFSQKATLYMDRIFENTRLAFQKPVTDNVTTVRQASNAQSQLIQQIPMLAVSANTLAQADYSDDTQVKSFVAGYVQYYNALLNAAQNVAAERGTLESEEVSQIKQVTRNYQTSLTQSGITIDSDDTLLFDEQAIASDDALRSTFANPSQYLSQIQNYAESFMQKLIVKREDMGSVSVDIYA